VKIPANPDPEELIEFAESHAGIMQSFGIPVTSDFVGLFSAFIMGMSEIANGDCQCTPCQCLRAAMENMEMP
jgi:hypothetical protein